MSIKNSFKFAVLLIFANNLFHNSNSDCLLVFDILPGLKARGFLLALYAFAYDALGGFLFRCGVP